VASVGCTFLARGLARIELRLSDEEIWDEEFGAGKIWDGSVDRDGRTDCECGNRAGTGAGCDDKGRDEERRDPIADWGHKDRGSGAWDYASAGEAGGQGRKRRGGQA
jgi:hypothetical protein